MVRCHGAHAGSGLQARLLLTIHDELLFEAPRSERDEACAPIEDIETSDNEHLDVLLSDLMCAAWGSALAQPRMRPTAP
jgi:DNA polymerase I-like protein with 3'-5' exonuclease and polymerase domains